MEIGRPSRTAFLVAAFRAQHFAAAAEPSIFNDSLAMGLIGMTSSAQIAELIENVVARLATLSSRRSAEVRVVPQSISTAAKLFDHSTGDIFGILLAVARNGESIRQETFLGDRAQSTNIGSLRTSSRTRASRSPI